MNLRVIRSSSRETERARIDGDASLGAAVGNVHDGGLQVISDARLRTSSRSTSG